MSEEEPSTLNKHMRAASIVGAMAALGAGISMSPYPAGTFRAGPAYAHAMPVIPPEARKLSKKKRLRREARK